MAAIWATGTVVGEGSGSVIVLTYGATWAPDTSIDSPSGDFRLEFQLDGNLVLTELPSTVLWESDTADLSADVLVMQDDGNLVIYAGATPLWASGTLVFGSYLQLQDDGNLVIYSFGGVEPIGVLTIPPDWQDGMLEKLEWMTSVTESPMAVEQRMGLRLSPRKSLEMSHTLFGSKRTFFDLFMTAGGGSPIYLPLFYDHNRIGAALTIGDDTITVDTTYSELRDCRRAVLISDNEFDYEVVEIWLYDDTTITLVAGVIMNWPDGTKIYPVKKSKVESHPAGDRHADKAYKARTRFLSLEKNDTNATATFSEYLGQPVLEEEPNDREALAFTYDRKMFSIDEKVGLQHISDVTPLNHEGYSWFAKRRQAAWHLRGLFYALEGRRRPLWIPSYFSDFELTQDTASDSVVLTVKRCGYADLGGPFEHREHILIHLRDGTRIYREVTSAALVSDTEETLEIDSAPGVMLTPDNVLRISFLSFCRLDQDSIEFTHHTDTKGLTTANSVFRTDLGVGNWIAPLLVPSEFRITSLSGAAFTSPPIIISPPPYIVDFAWGRLALTFGVQPYVITDTKIDSAAGDMIVVSVFSETFSTTSILLLYWDSQQIISASWADGKVTFVTTVDSITLINGVLVGDIFTISGMVPDGYNGTYTALAGTGGNTLIGAKSVDPGPALTFGSLDESKVEFTLRRQDSYVENGWPFSQELWTAVPYRYVVNRAVRVLGGRRIAIITAQVVRGQHLTTPFSQLTDSTGASIVNPIYASSNTPGVGPSIDVISSDSNTLMLWSVGGGSIPANGGPPPGFGGTAGLATAVYGYGRILYFNEFQRTEPNFITSAVWYSVDGGTVTFTSTYNHNVGVGESFKILGMTPDGYNGSYTATIGRAFGTITFGGGLVLENDTLTINGNAMVFKTTAVLDHEVTIGSTTSETAANVISEINAFSSLYGVTASGEDNIVVVYSNVLGADGNSMTLSEAASNVTLSGSTLRGGTTEGVTLVAVLTEDPGVATVLGLTSEIIEPTSALAPGSGILTVLRGLSIP